MKFKFFSSVFHTFLETGPTSFSGFVHFFIHVCNKWACLLSAGHFSKAWDPAVVNTGGLSLGSFRGAWASQPPGSPHTHLWGHHTSLLLLQNTEKHSLTIVLPRLSRKSAATMGIWAAAL